MRSKLVLLSAAPVTVTGAILLALFLWGHARAIEANDEVMAWHRHAEALRTLDWAARFYVDTVADGIEQDPMPHGDESRAKLRQARTDALLLSERFSPEEQAAQKRLDAHLDELVVDGERVQKDRGRLRALTAKYNDSIAKEIRERVQEEESGTADAVRAAAHISREVRLGGFAVALLSLLAALGLSVVAIRRFGSRVASLQQAAARVAAGDVRQRVPVTSADEVGQLAGSMNVMIEALRNQRERQLGFVAAVAHDLKNPLGAMYITTESLLAHTEASSKPRLEKPLALLERQIERLTRMADDLLDAVNVEVGELKLEQRSCDLVPVARDVTELYAETSPRHELRLAVPGEPVLLTCDPTRITQVLENLVKNAIKYSPAGGPVDVTLVPADDEVVLSVADRGVGIAPEMLDAIFEPFRRLDGTKDVTPGVGLGLSTCRRIVAAHGGRIEVESQPGHRTTFNVHLPRSGRGSASGA